MRWILAWHIIFMVSWFGGLFYLPRLFVYHAECDDQVSKDRFKIMEKKLFYFITTPAGILTTLFGVWLLSLHWSFYSAQGWMQLKLLLVLLLWLFHFCCGYYLQQLKQDHLTFSSIFFRWFNEIPAVLLILIVILVVVKP